MWVSSGQHYFDCEGTILACYEPHADGDPQEVWPNPEEIYFAVPDLDETFRGAQVAGCRKIDESIGVRPWG